MITIALLALVRLFVYPWPMHSQLSRREFLVVTTSSLLAGAAATGAEPAPVPIIDIHQHTNYSGRTNAQLIAHQNALGVTTTVLLPAGRLYGLDADCGRNDTVLALANQRPNEYVFFANEITDIPEARAELETYLRRGAIGIGEQKFKVACDSPEFQRVAEVAQQFNVPILMHFMHDRYNTGIERFHTVLEKFPKVNFIGHAQTWWGNVDKNHEQKSMYPTSKVTPGGITDRLLSDYPNMFGDLSAGSGLNFFTRDEDHARAFLQRHQDKLMFGSDCNDVFGRGPGCQGANILANIRKCAASKTVERKILFENAKRIMRLSV
ncbi:MAG: amidohydrolase [Verrucomicrobia subdivision 3 bacterium]|nr:amidohydrolase [Limisphaerales bacterium]